MEFHIKRSRFSVKFRFKESNCADAGHSLNRDFTAIYFMTITRYTVDSNKPTLAYYAIVPIIRILFPKINWQVSLCGGLLSCAVLYSGLRLIG